MSSHIKGSRASDFAIEEEETHIQIAQACLRYHLYLSKAHGKLEPVTVKVFEFPLWEYAARFGLHHVEAVAQDQWSPSLYHRLEAIFEPRGAPFHNLVRIQATLEREGYFLTGTRNTNTDHYAFPSPLYYVVFMQYHKLTEYIIKAFPTQINRINGFLGTALNLACSLQDLSAVETLLGAGANPYLGNGNCNCALEVAYSDAIKKRLLEIPGMLEECAKLDYLPLVDAAYWGNLEDMEFWLKHGADINARTKDGRSAYTVAVQRGDMRTLEFIQAHGGGPQS